MSLLTHDLSFLYSRVLAGDGGGGGNSELATTGCRTCIGVRRSKVLYEFIDEPLMAFHTGYDVMYLRHACDDATADPSLYHYVTDHTHDAMAFERPILLIPLHLQPDHICLHLPRVGTLVPEDEPHDKRVTQRRTPR